MPEEKHISENRIVSTPGTYSIFGTKENTKAPEINALSLDSVIRSFKILGVNEHPSAYHTINITASGNWWTLYETGLLDIYCVGDMPNFSFSSPRSPWNNYAGQIVRVKLRETVTSIGDYAFFTSSSYSGSLYLNFVEIEIPDSVTQIGKDAFSKCSSLRVITGMAGVTSFGYGAFHGCNSLKTFTIPAGLDRINDFNGLGPLNVCTSLEYIYVSDGNEAFLSDDGILFSKDKSYLYKYPSMRGGTDYEIPIGVNRIAEYAFSYCKNLVSITIADSVTTIGYAAFLRTKLSNIIIPNSVTNISDQVFQQSGVTEVTIPSSVTNFGNSLFYNCANLEYVTIPSIALMSGSTFSGCHNLKSITLLNPDSVTSIGDHVFQDCTSLTSFKIPDNVTSIGWRAFLNCTSLTSVKIPNSVTFIDDYAFGETALKSVTINRNCTLGRLVFPTDCVVNYYD